MPLRKRRYQEPMSHAYLREMIDAAKADIGRVVMSVSEAEVLMDEFEFYRKRAALQKPITD